jgi:RNA polymerase sigma-70 factor, ECF subfamily
LAAAIDNPMVSQTATKLDEVFLAHHARVLRTAYQVTGSMTDAEDVAQSVFLRLACGEINSRRITYLESYLLRAAVNAGLDLLRARRNREIVPVERAETLQSSSAISPERLHFAWEIRDQLRRGLANLHPLAAEMFTLRYLEEMDNREIARLLDTSQAVVAVTLFRARARLKKELSGFRKGVL